MKRLRRTKKHLKYIFSLVTAIVLLASNVVTTAIQTLLLRLGIMTDETMLNSGLLVGIISAAVCVIIGTCLSLITNRYILNPVNTLFDGMEKLSDGRYDTRIDLGGNQALQVAADSFNSLAEELENTEILRSDFINNFSHEFKTPMVSIKGLIGLLKSGRVPKEKQTEYLLIIEEEIDRLTTMTTNVLNLSKIENQSIIVDKERYNLSEQIRACILLDEKKWSEKNLTLSLDLDEHVIVASEDLLKQVFINLIDNAVKFSPHGGTLAVKINDAGQTLSVSVSNDGEPISEEERGKIWNKFYRAESAHAKSGNGIGLSIVKSITELHGGSVSVESAGGVNTFTVTLPKE